MEGEARPCFPHTSPSHEESGLKHGFDRNTSACRKEHISLPDFLAHLVGVVR